jgi:peptidoglycan/xylan/chitin deacetylase (PgdA/CDA1 family)
MTGGLQREVRDALVALMKPEDGFQTVPREEEAIERFLLERYLPQGGNWKRSLYYRMKPLIPRPVQLALRRRYVDAQAKMNFPAWPIEDEIVDRVRAFEGRVISEAGVFCRLAYWPKGVRFAFVITHDVEWDSGLKRAPALLEVERELGFVSSWNLVPERYPIDWAIVNRLRQAGSEIGIHGLRHDGRLFSSKRVFQSRLKKIEEYAKSWGAVGFRSPSTLRNPEWMKLMTFEYDSSFPDTDPYEPQPGGCCAVWPYFLGEMVELPLTMPQDHTLYEILRHQDLRLWNDKVDWLEAAGGLVLINVHPDYMMTSERLRHYEAFLVSMKGRAGMWHALPKDVAGWWKDRDASTFRKTGERYTIEGPAADRASVVRVSATDSVLHHDPVT